MRIQQFKFIEIEDLEIDNQSSSADNHLVLAFCNRKLLEKNDEYAVLKKYFPTATIVLTSTSGSIMGEQIVDHTVVTSIIFEKTTIKAHKVSIENCEDSHKGGTALAGKFDTENLSNLLVFSDGQIVNGTTLINSIQNNLPDNLIITGGLAGDDADFEKTLVGLNEAPSSATIVGIGLYGNDINVGFGSYGGWNPFGPKRIVTKSMQNVLYELDGESALGLYKKYLGDLAKELPSSALLFPLKVETKDKENYLVRTILNVSEENQSMTFAGDIPEGAIVQLMKANFDKLIDGAALAANQSIDESTAPELALLISCVGRRLVLGQRAEEELEESRQIFGDKTVMTGFYSYGEISPFHGLKNCELHNQTMTITTLSEV